MYNTTANWIYSSFFLSYPKSDFKGTYHRADDGNKLYECRTLTPDCHENSKEDSGSIVKKVGNLGTLRVIVKLVSYIQHCNSRGFFFFTFCKNSSDNAMNLTGIFLLDRKEEGIFFCETVWIWKGEFVPFMGLSLSWAFISSPNGAMKNFLLHIIKTNTHAYLMWIDLYLRPGRGLPWWRSG